MKSGRGAIFRRMKASVRVLTGLVLCCVASAGAQSLPPVAAFVGTRSLEGVSLSPDGRYLALLMRAPQGRVAIVRDLTDQTIAPKPVMNSSPEAQLTWCRWASGTRLLCGYEGAVRGAGFIYSATRLTAVDADGKHWKVLINDSRVAGGQFQDQVLSASLADPNTVLIQADESLIRNMPMDATAIGRTISEFPAVEQLNIVTGEMRVLMPSFHPIRRYLADRHGEVRVGWGFENHGTEISYYARYERSPGTHVWKLLFKHDAFAQTGYQPLAVCIDQPDCVFAMAGSEGRDALWRMDLTGATAPKLEFAHPAVDVAGPVFGSDGRLLGVVYETDRPFFFPVDPKVRAIIDALKAPLGNTFVRPVDSSSDENVFLVHTSSDIDPGTFYLLDVAKGSLRPIGSAYPDLDKKSLPRLQSISFPAADGTTIPGYLTVPVGRRAEHLPLIVMPHGGPQARDHWNFDFLRLFLASRGYAVLQVNFRGSTGYGTKWLMDAHQDWGGLTYSDITDGARWVVKQGIADPAHMCILGWSFGGYAALVGAVRNGDLYRCAVSIAGISDLSLLESQLSNFTNSGIAREQIGTLRQKLKDDSPQRHAADAAMPVLLIHGDMDAQSNVEQSIAMDDALAHAHKNHELVIIKGGRHSLSLESERTTLLTTLERFLAENLGPGAPAASAN